MDEQTFQKWMEEVVPMMTQLSLAQTRTFFGVFLERCTVEQKIFFESEVQSYIVRDIMTLPSLVIDRILQFLDIHELFCLGLVSRSWRHTITRKSWLWKSVCQRFGAKVTNHSDRSDTYYFHLFLSLRRVLSQMASGKAFDIRKDRLADRRYDAQSYNQIACSNDAIVVEYKGQLLVVDAQTKETLWERKGYVSSCLHISDNLIVAGTFLGKLRVLSLDGNLEHEIQCGVNVITSLDVHVSGRFLIACFGDCSVRLLDNKMEIFSVNLQSSHSAELAYPSVAVKVYFLPDCGLSPGQLVICVGRFNSWSAAVITETGTVLHQLDHHFQCCVQTFCRSSFDPSVIHCDLQALSRRREDSQPAQSGRLFYGSRIETYRIHCDSRGISSQCVTRHSPCAAASEFKSSLDATHLLAAGKTFAVAAFRDDLVVFRLSCGSVVCTVECFFEGHNVSKLSLYRELDSMAAVNVSWLDGLSPSTTSVDTPIVVSCIADKTSIKSLYWSPELWECSTEVEDCHGNCPRDSGDACESSDDNDNSNSNSESQDILSDSVLKGSEIERDTEGCPLSSGNVDESESCEGKTSGTGKPDFSSDRFGIWRNAALFKDMLKRNSQCPSSLFG